MPRRTTTLAAAVLAAAALAGCSAHPSGSEAPNQRNTPTPNVTPRFPQQQSASASPGTPGGPG